jgi:hypothetical protein
MGRGILRHVLVRLMTEDFHLYRSGRLQQWRATAAHVKAHPEALEIPLSNISRWLEKGRLHPAPLLEWRRRIHLAQSSPDELEILIAYLAANNFDSEPLKSCSPFVGIANTGEGAHA